MKEKKLLYIWEPIYNKITIVTKDYFKELIGNKKSISSYIANAIKKETYLPKLNCYISKEPLTVSEKRKRIAKLKFKNEIWKESNLSGLFISNEGRFRRKTLTGYTYTFPYLRKNHMTIKYQSNEYVVKRLVYQTFIGILENHERIYSKNGIKEDFRPSNLKKVSMTELGKLTGYKSKSKGIVHVSKEGKLIREFKSTREAERITLYNRQTINESCNNARKNYHSLGYRAFLWSDEYYNNVKEN
ncbi:hypothetical protein [Staphylococcus epidermidis]|uniref:hypothetical protein n=1 Tax=Staphylococcus epidermidis TaxID=1282 RepID=UPI0038B5ECCF